MCVCVFCVCIWMCVRVSVYVHYLSKVFGYPQKCLLLVLKVLFLMKQVKHLNVFIYYTQYKSSLVTLIFEGIFLH